VRLERLLALIAVALVSALSACGDDNGGGTTREARSIRVGLSFTPGVDDAADRVAYDQLASEKGVRARFTETGGPPNTVAALAHGDVDMGSTSLLSAVKAIDQGANLKVILGEALAVDFFIVAKKDIATVGDLKGKQVAYGEPGGNSEVVTKVALARAGVDEKDVDLRIIDDAQRRAAALANGKVDAIALEYPDVQLLLAKEPDLHTVASLHDLEPSLVADVLVVKSSFAEKNRDLIDDVVGGLLDGYEFVRTDDGRAAWRKQARSAAGDEELPVLERVYDRQDEVGYWPHKDTPMTADRYNQSLRFWRDQKLLDRDVPFEKVWDVSAWQKAAD
jgi:ABC-type nitrate/sulfonate/bicarbonate transport system substrate-binding protein